MIEQRFLSWNNENFNPDTPFIRLYCPDVIELQDHEEWIIAGRCYIQRKPCVQQRYNRDKEKRAQCENPLSIAEEVAQKIGDNKLCFLQNPYPYDVAAAHQVLYFRNSDPTLLDYGEHILRQLCVNNGIHPINDVFCIQNIEALRTVVLPHIHVFSTVPLVGSTPVVF